jgi:hypothetical protein
MSLPNVSFVSSTEPVGIQQKDIQTLGLLLETNKKSEIFSPGNAKLFHKKMNFAEIVQHSKKRSILLRRIANLFKISNANGRSNSNA